MDVPFRSDPLKFRVALIPLRAQPLDHFMKPDPLRVTRGHVKLYCAKASQQKAALCSINGSENALSSVVFSNL
jgi:hypothetical protein